MTKRLFIETYTEIEAIAARLSFLVTPYLSNQQRKSVARFIANDAEYVCIFRLANDLYLADERIEV